MGAHDQVAELLAGVPLFSALPDEIRSELVTATGVTALKAGDLLFREGDVGTCLYVVASGRLEVSVGDQVVRTQSRGDVIGELAIISRQPRSASVRALRDSSLVVLHQDPFLDVLFRRREVAAGLLDVLTARLPRAGYPPPRKSGRGVVMIGGFGRTEAGLVTRISRQLVEEVSTLTAVASLAPEDATTEWGATLDRLEAASDLVVLTAPEPNTPWAHFCHRQSDRRLAVVDVERPAAGDSLSDDADLVVVGSAGLAPRWLESHHRRRHLVDSRQPGPGVRRMARRLAGRSVGVVLSGGGARGLAHLGVVEVMLESGVEIDRWGGTSMGALIAALIATGRPVTEVTRELRRELTKGHPFGDYTLPRHSLIRAERAGRMLRRLLADRSIEELERPYFSVSCDLYGAVEMVHRKGPLVEAVGASMRIPGVAPPLLYKEQLLVDGGVLNNLPVDVMAADDEGPVIGVDVMRPFIPQAVLALPSILETIGRAMVLGSWQKTARTRALADLIITPELGEVGMFDFSRIDELVALGRLAGQLKATDLANIAHHAGVGTAG